MSVLLAILAFVLIVIGLFTQVTHSNSEVRFAVTWTTAISATVLIIFAAKVYFS